MDINCISADPPPASRVLPIRSTAAPECWVHALPSAVNFSGDSLRRFPAFCTKRLLGTQVAEAPAHDNFAETAPAKALFCKWHRCCIADGAVGALKWCTSAQTENCPAAHILGLLQLGFKGYGLFFCWVSSIAACCQNLAYPGAAQKAGAPPIAACGEARISLGVELGTRTPLVMLFCLACAHGLCSFNSSDCLLLSSRPLASIACSTDPQLCPELAQQTSRCSS